jgi:hypothetical protein
VEVQHVSGSGTLVQVVEDDTLPGGPREKRIEYVAPFTKCDREEDYEVVWAEFERRFGGGGDGDGGLAGHSSDGSPDRGASAGEVSDDVPELESAAPLANSTPIDKLDPPGQVSAMLEHFGVRTVGDLLSVELDEAQAMKGVGPTRFAAFRELVDEARAALPDDDTDETHETHETDNMSSNPMAHELHLAGVDLETPWQDVLIDLSARTANGLVTGGWTTLEEVTEAVSDGSYRAISGIGKSSVDEMREELASVAALGVETYVYGEAGRPASIAQLIEHALSWLDDEDRALLEARIFDDRPLREIGEERGVTRQRIQQIEAGIIDDLQKRLGSVACELMAPVVSGLEMSAGLLHTSLLDNFTDETNPRRLKLGLLIAGEEDADVRLDEFLTTLSATDRDELVREVRDGLQELDSIHVDISEAVAVMGEVGLFIDARAAARFLELVFEIGVDDGAFTLPWINHADVIAEALRDIGRAADTGALMDAYDHVRVQNPDLELHELAPHALQANAHRHPDVYNYAHGMYIHADCLPMSPEALDEAVEWSIARLAEGTGQISVSALIDEMEYERITVPGLTDHLLKDALGRHADKVLVFKNTLLVAHADTYEDDGLTMTDRVEQVLLDADEPLTVRQILDELSDFGYSRHSIYDHILKVPWAISLHRGEFAHRASIGLSDDQLETLLDAAHQALPEDGSAEAAHTLLARLEGPATDKLRERDDAADALVVLANSDDRFATATGGLIARATDDGDSLLRVAIYDILDDLGLAYPRELHIELEEQLHYTGSVRPIRNILHRGHETDDLGRLPGALYFHAGDDEEELFATWSKRPEKLLEAARHNERETTDPQLVWQMARFIERVVDEDDLAEELLDLLMARDDVPAAIKEEADALKFALSMGMG